MSYEIFSIKDVLSGNMTDLKLFPNVAMAKRWFEETCSECKFSKDLQLFKLGTYDTQVGITSNELEFIMAGV